jgi:hypothetical protein
MNDTRPSDARLAVHRLRGVLGVTLERATEFREVLAGHPEYAGVRDQLVETLREQGSMGTLRSLADAVEAAIVRFPL